MKAVPLPPTDCDVAVIGGGPAGLSGALYLARSGRRVIVVDSGNPRNAPAEAAHGLLTRDGTAPRELIASARRQFARYPSATICDAEAIDAKSTANGFRLALANGSALTARKLLLACGVRDELPPIDGLQSRWGTDVHACLYCHGHEQRRRPLGVIAQAEDAKARVAELLPLSRDLLLCTDGSGMPAPEDLARMSALGVRVAGQRIRKVRGARGRPVLHFADGSTAAVHVLYVRTKLSAASPLPHVLSCRFADEARILVDDDWQTSVPGVYAAGDLAVAARFLVVAAASGAQAAIAIAGTLAREDFGGAWHEPLCGSTSALRLPVHRAVS